MDTEIVSLAEVYPKEQARCRELLGRYKEIGPAGAFGYLSIKKILDDANKASAEHDTVAMLRCYWQMKGCQ